jgi:lantibiotic modifying enzyme
MTSRGKQDLYVVAARLIEPALTRLARDLGSDGKLGSSERQSVFDGLALGLREKVFRKVARVLLLELHAARISGRLTASDPAGRWDEWMDQVSRCGYWDSLAQRYPTLASRLDKMIGNFCRANLLMAQRFCADRTALAKLCGGEPELTGVTIGAGDSHQGGQTVAVLRLAHGRVLYKPRPLEVDVALAQALRDLLPEEPTETRIRVPEAIARNGYGWAEYVGHRYCANDEELRLFYRGLGHWLAVTRLLAASDLHSENLIAAGPVPVVVDCETLFTPRAPRPPSGYGAALDHAADLVSNSLLRTGLLPGRGTRLGLRGADISAAGALPDQQPTVEVTTIVGVGTDQARLAVE